MTYTFYESPVGRLLLSAEDGAVSAVELAFDRALPMTGTEEAGEARILFRLVRELDEYFGGERRTFDVPMRYTCAAYPGISPFRKAVWDAMRRIPFGEVRSYAGVAAMAGNPLACRAAGNACHANHLLLLVPCHRVVAAHGLGGFGGGLDVKRRLLQWEGVCLDNFAAVKR